MRTVGAAVPGYAEYEPADGADAAQMLSPMDMASFVLATCATVGDAIAAMESVTVWSGPMPVIGVPPLHLVLHDATGRSAVIEYVGGERHVYENPLGVCTNSPPLDWHLANLRNYINLTPDRCTRQDGGEAAAQRDRTGQRPARPPR